MMLAMIVAAGCAGTPRYQLETAPPGTLRLGQVVGVDGPGQIVEPAVSILKKRGFTDAEIQSGALAGYRVWCCRPNDPLVPIAFVPAGLAVAPGDIVEVKTADPQMAGTAAVHQVTRVAQKWGEDKGIRWEPPDPSNPNDETGYFVLWTRCLHAPWMEQEGWKLRGGMNKAWYKDVGGN